MRNRVQGVTDKVANIKGHLMYGCSEVEQSGKKMWMKRLGRRERGDRIKGIKNKEKARKKCKPRGKR